MHSATLNAAALSLLSATVAAKSIRVDVGKGGLIFAPDSIQADNGDTVEFHFSKVYHSVVEGDFDNACNPVSSGGFYSGTRDADSDNAPYFQITVNSTDPIFYYCSVGDHCEDGMVGVINPTSDKTLAAYKDASAQAAKAVSPPKAFGGIEVTPTGGATRTATDTGSMTSMTGAMTSMTGSMSSMTGAMTSGSAMSSASAAATTNASGSSASSAAANTASGTSAASSPSTTSKANAISQLATSVVGVVAMVAGVAAWLL